MERERIWVSMSKWTVKRIAEKMGRKNIQKNGHKKNIQKKMVKKKNTKKYHGRCDVLPL